MTKEINWETIDGMLIAGCNGIQCAAAIGVHHDTLYDRCVQDNKVSFSVYSQAKRAHGDALLHAAQFHKAYKDKNPTMLIWLGKQRLKQKEDMDAKSEDMEMMDKKFDAIIAQFAASPSTLNIEESNTSSEQKS